MKKTIKTIFIIITIGLISVFIYNITIKNTNNDINNNYDTGFSIEKSVDIKQVDIEVKEDTKLPVGK